MSMQASIENGSGWSQQYGAECPACGAFTKASYKRGPWRNGLKTRFHVCANPSCACRFKSVEEDSARFTVPPAPEQLRYVRAV